MKSSRLNQILSAFGVEDVLCVLLLAFFAMAGSIPGIAPNQASGMTNTPATGFMAAAGILSQLVVNAIILGLLLFNARKMLLWNRALQWNLAIILAALSSVAWSADPLLTLRRAIPFALAALFGLYFAVRFVPRRQLQILWFTFVLLAIASAVAALAFPSVGLDASTGYTHDWQGVFTQKNACGRVMVLASVVVFSIRAHRGLRAFSLLLFTGVLLMSGSRGAWVIELSLFALWLGFLITARLRKQERAFVFAAVAIALVLCAFLVVSFLPELALLLGRDPTLSGRIAIWHHVWRAILRHPLLGYGLSAFWQGLHGATHSVIFALHFVLFHAHNGFLEIWLELGALGLLLFIFSYLRACRKVLPHLLGRDSRSVLWMGLFLFLIAVYNIGENTFLTSNGIFWVLYVAVLADIELLAPERPENVLAFPGAARSPVYYGTAAARRSSLG
ncbi:MAG: O-antigen ligase family protein [Acidobacteria bacterium]|nr:O-antigen ligase family protein [Acidobacteriota bacterium]MBW4044198.1 O-antigen ligase family protein [Acidobacteriota bacterium]